MHVNGDVVFCRYEFVQSHLVGVLCGAESVRRNANLRGAVHAPVSVRADDLAARPKPAATRNRQCHTDRSSDADEVSERVFLRTCANVMSILLLQRHRSVLCERQCGAVLSEHHQFVWRHALLCGPSRSVRVSWIQSELGQRRGGDIVC